MGRRAVKPVDPSLDLSCHLKRFDELPDPWQPEQLFRVEQPLQIEVGCGKGLFMRTASGEFADHNFLGIEIAHRYAVLAAAKLAKLGRTNAVMVSGDGQRVFRELLPADSIAAVHVYFPDPWWKKRHRKRRVMNADFVSDVVRVLQPGGCLHFWTDVAEYFEVTLELLAQFPQLAGPEAVAERPAEHHLDFRTHFERRMRLSGEAVYRSLYRKQAATAQIG
jgi:tRNA (guanine-N7-)-methyltransferase